ncbi:MAG TPA: hypothetical protein VIY70_00020, partial [Acidimicrobiia bacterium]
RGRSAAALELVQEILQGILDSDDPQAAVDELIEVGPELAGRIETLVDTARGVTGQLEGFEKGDEVADYARMLVELLGLRENAQGDPGRPDSTPVGPPDGVPAGPPATPSGNPEPGPPSP